MASDNNYILIESDDEDKVPVNNIPPLGRPCAATTSKIQIFEILDSEDDVEILETRIVPAPSSSSSSNISTPNHEPPTSLASRDNADHISPDHIAYSPPIVPATAEKGMRHAFHK
jgi:hypothetical protein